ncbi:Translation initiation factor eIF-2B subunit gamma [Colletotrichum orbiculare MAFF 240422]|uniref:Translation initiation factor eIF2B subunit gamma n=2 Tax=Colletotrichum orbiculare species complex TaxID=2707354 RepID=N4W121_COLOR|nr:Translation initiation factor eIF-2B subunit gamma [Colletotrichum orbiculare MAFF 240422]TDZ27894.1 Translation initiation factor eIF-2B subunit gamma [Colletotrichum spinosum]
MPHAVSMPSPGLQALILCGPGSSFSTFTSNPDENPKALLPIANRPMVWYPIDFCYRTGITNITLICPSSAEQALTTALNTNPYLTALPLPRPDILAPKDLDQTTGTADILRLPEVKELVTSDFVILPCDLICEIAGEKLLQAWMVKGASIADVLGAPRFSGSKSHSFSGGLGMWYETKTATPVKGEETDFVAITPSASSTIAPPKGSLLPHLSNLVYSMPTDSLKDLTEEKKGLPIRHGLMRSHPRIRMLTTHRDAHLYILPRWIMDFVEKNERLENISEDVIGWWAKSGWQKGLPEKLHLDEILRRDSEDDDDSVPESVTSPHDDEPEQSHTTGGVEDSNPAERNEKDACSRAEELTIPPMLAYVHPSQADAPLVRRVDTAQLLLNVSLQLAKLPSVEEMGSEAASPFAHAKKVAYPEGVKGRTTITKADSLVAENVTVEEKVAIKESVVGANCQLNEGAKLLQCLLMEGAIVGKNCKLTRCILGKRCVIGDGSVLTNVEVQENLLVEAKTEEKDTKLMSSDGLEATEEEMQGVLEDMDQEVMAQNEEAVE